MEVEHYRPELGIPEENDASIYWLRVMSTSLGIWPEKFTGSKRNWWKRLYYFMIIMHWYNAYLQVEFFFHNLGELKTVTEVSVVVPRMVQKASQEQIIPHPLGLTYPSNQQAFWQYMPDILLT